MTGAGRRLEVDGPFQCCGNEDLWLLRCPACGHLMVFCSECDTLFPDITRPEHSTPVSLTREDQRLTCPACAVPFQEYGFLRPQNVGKYLPTREQVIAAGFGHWLGNGDNANETGPG